MVRYGIAAGLSAGQPLSTLEPMLERIVGAGFTHVELSGKSLGVMQNGALNPDRLAILQSILTRSPLHFTLHGSEVSSGRGGNVLDQSTPSQQLAVRADIALATEIGASVIVYHSGMLRHPGGDGRGVAAGMEAERRVLTELGDIAGEAGITIAVENRDPVGRYILRQAYGLDLERLAAQVEAVDHPHVGVCLDAGHAWLSYAWLGKDYLAAVRRIAPLVVHMHVNDNFGQPQLDETSDQSENLVQGLGDLHLMPGWGNVPFDEITAIPFPHAPIVVLELRPAYADHLDLASERTREIAERIVARSNAAR